eukprot:g81692.t1
MAPILTNRCYCYSCCACWLCSLQALLVPFLLLYLRGPIYYMMAPLETRAVSPDALWCKELELYEPGHLFMFASAAHLPPLDVRLSQLANLSVALPRPSSPVYYYESFYQHLNSGSSVQFNICPIKGSAAGSASLQIMVFAGESNFDNWRTESGAWSRYYFYDKNVFVSSPSACSSPSSWVNVTLSITNSDDYYFVMSNNAPDTTNLDLKALIDMNKTEYNLTAVTAVATDCSPNPSCKLGWRTSDQHPVAIVQAPPSNGTIDPTDFPFFNTYLTCSPDTLMFIAVFGLGFLGVTLVFVLLALFGAYCMSLGPWLPRPEDGVSDLYDALNDDGCELEPGPLSQEEKEEKENEILDVEPDKPGSINDEEGKKIVDESKDNTCGICAANRKNAVLVPCGHLYACIPCSRKLRNGNFPCPLCRKPIRSVLRVFT